jgi:membrane protease YdiL (CAAX protease family)
MTQPRPAQALFWTCAGVVLVSAAGVAPDADSAITPMQLALSTAISACGLAALALAGAAWWGHGTGRALGLERGRVGGVRLAMLVAGVVGTSQLLDAVLAATGWRDGSVLVELDRTIGAAHAGEWLALALAVGLAASIAEELLFRGFVLRWCTARFGVATGVVASSLIFGLLHLDAAQGAAAVILGALLAGVALATGSTRAAIACHIANNLAALLSAALPLEPGPVWLAFAAACAFLGAWTLYRALRDAPLRSERHPQVEGGLQAGSGSADL